MRPAIRGWYVFSAAAIMLWAVSTQAQLVAGSGHAATVFADRSVLVVGGRDSSGNPTTGAVLYATDGPDLPIIRGQSEHRSGGQNSPAP
jgi:hypothetical protein